jgi:selenocysteine lyase/cysteine desulfurase
MLPWIASLQLLLGVGIETIAEWDQRLVDRFVAGLDAERYRLVSPQHGSARSTLVVVSDARGDAKRLHHRLEAAGIDVAFREGNLRLSMHLFNTPAEVDAALDVLHADSGSGGARSSPKG